MLSKPLLFWRPYGVRAHCRRDRAVCTWCCFLALSSVTAYPTVAQPAQTRGGSASSAYLMSLVLYMVDGCYVAHREALEGVQDKSSRCPLLRAQPRPVLACGVQNSFQRHGLVKLWRRCKTCPRLMKLWSAMATDSPDPKVHLPQIDFGEGKPVLPTFSSKIVLNLNLMESILERLKMVYS